MFMKNERRLIWGALAPFLFGRSFEIAFIRKFI